MEAAKHILTHDLRSHVSPTLLAEFHIEQPKVLEEDIASGDKFFAKEEDFMELRKRLPSVAFVEMEGAAVAQVCHEHGVPFLIIRTISNSANEADPIEFPKFVERVASAYSHAILRNLVKRLYPIGKNADS